MSIGLKYGSIPPQLVLGKALKARHFLLASVSIVTLLSSVLAVTLGSLFEVKATLIGQLHHCSPVFLPQFSGNYSNLGITHGNDYIYITRARLEANTSLPAWTTSDFCFIPVSIHNTTSSSLYGISTSEFGIDPNCQALGNSISMRDIVSSVSPSGSSVGFLGSYSPNDGGEDILCVAINEATYNPRPTANSTDNGLDSPLNSGRYALSLSSPMASFNDSSERSVSLCQSITLFRWIHTTFNQVNQTDTSTLQQSNPDILTVSCQPILKTANFTVQTTVDGHVLSYALATPFETDHKKYFDSHTNANELYRAMATVLSLNLDDADMSWRNDTHAPDTMSYFIRLLTDSTALNNPQVLLSSNNTSYLSALDAIQRQLFSVLLSEYPQMLVPATSDELVDVQTFTSRPRVFMNFTSFVISMIILMMDLIVAISLFFNRPAPFLPRMPTSIASMFAFVAASHARGELCRGQRSEKYRFGRYIGVDRKLHIGIDNAERVFPLSASHRDVRIMWWLKKGERPPAVPPKD